MREARLKQYIVIVVALFMIFVSDIFPQSDEVIQISLRAQQMVEQGNWEEATKLLTTVLSEDSIEIKSEDRGLLTFSLGYLFYKRAEEGSESKAENLDKAMSFYKRSLEYLPQNIQVMTNLILALKKAGKWNEATQILHKAVELDTVNRNTYFMELGDIYRAMNKSQDALRYYQRCAEIEPRSQTVHWKILNVYRELGKDKIKDLYEYCNKLKYINLTELAKNGFEMIMEMAFDEEEKKAEEALIRWAEIGASQGWISVKSLRALPDKEKWASPAIKELHELVGNPDLSPHRLNWWTRDLVRRHVAAYVLRSIGMKYLTGKDSERAAINPTFAARTYEMALEIAPHLQEYQYSRLRPIIPISIAVELASLYHKYRRTDPDGQKFSRLERELFNDKSYHYAERDLESILRSHTILGLIYAEREVWRSSWRPANAIFQLQHAIDTSQKLYEGDPKKFQPLPHLKKLLADGYKITGRDKYANKYYVEAAIDYLELDSLRDAELVLIAADDVPAGNLKLFRSVRKVWDTRKAINELHADNLNPDSQVFVEKLNQFDWIFSSTDLGLDGSFVNRQRFRALSDIGTMAVEMEAGREALWFHTSAMRTIEKENILPSMEDVVRIERIKSTVFKNIQVEDENNAISTGVALTESSLFPGGKIWWLPSFSDQQPIQVGISHDFMLAGKVGNVISKEHHFDPESVQLSLQNGEVIIYPEYQTDIESKISENTIRNLRSIKGIRQIKITKK